MKIVSVLCLLFTTSFSYRVPQKVRQNVVETKSKRDVAPKCGESKAFYDGDRRVGGRPALEGEFPRQVSLQVLTWWSDDFESLFGGSLISDQFVLTAAHCIYE
jgi:hypothetical protein